MPISGGQVYLNFGWEAVAYGTEATAIDKTFGHATNNTAHSLKNGLKSIRGLGSRNATALTVGKFEGTFGVEFTMSNPWFWKAVLGASATGAGPPYTHTFTEANTIPSLTIEKGMDLTVDSVIKILGWKCNTCTIKATVGEPVIVTLDGNFKTETEGTSLGSQVAETFDPYIFAEGTLKIPASGSAIAYVESAELTITNNAGLQHGLGSRFATGNIEKAREYTFNISVNYDAAATLLELFYGGGTGPISAKPADQATLELKFIKGSGGTEKSQTITLTTLNFDESTIPTSVDDVIKLGLTGTALSCGVLSVDTVAAVP